MFHLKTPFKKKERKILKTIKTDESFFICQTNSYNGFIALDSSEFIAVSTKNEIKNNKIYNIYFILILIVVFLCLCLCCFNYFYFQNEINNLNNKIYIKENYKNE